MAPLKNRINSTFHRINDKMKRHRLSDDGAAVPSKQPRTLPTDGFLQGQPSGNQNNLYLPAQPSKPSSTTFAVATAGPSFPASFSSTLHDSQTTANVWSTPSPTSSMSVEYTHYSPATDFPEGPATRGTAANPIGMYFCICAVFHNTFFLAEAALPSGMRAPSLASHSKP